MQINSYRELISCFVKKQDKPNSQNNFEDEMFREKELVVVSKTFPEKNIFKRQFFTCNLESDV